ncbi:MAG: lmo0937 family membrane protein [Gemmatimonadota bacterium]|nr:lmo0937 family membrane protein [Gemmatimonadota bacterium]
MLWLIAIVVLILWILGWIVFEIAEGLIHLLLVVAAIVILYQVFTSR